MKAVQRFDIDGQEALRITLLEELTGARDDKSLLKEHYDWLQELTSVSKKTLRRFFRERIKVGPQTRNLLAAVALGRKDELNSLTESQKDYYLLFLESLQSVNHQPEIIVEPDAPRHELREILSQKYTAYGFVNMRNDIDLYQALMGARVRKPHDDDRFLLTEYRRNGQQQIPLDKSLILGQNKTILLGEAGMGKSTLAKNLCRDWSFSQEGITPIYVDLKSEYYNGGEHGVMDFLLQFYFGQRLDWALTEFLEKESETYCLLLDGFDDLSAKDKSCLMEEVNEFSQSIRYTILSRPYGFGDFSYPCKSVYKVLGLNDGGRRMLLEKYMDDSSSQIKLSALLSYLEEHPVLSRLSRCPMSLIRIVRLSGSEMFYELLDDVESGLDLQNLFINYSAQNIKN